VPIPIKSRSKQLQLDPGLIQDIVIQENQRIDKRVTSKACTFRSVSALPVYPVSILRYNVQHYLITKYFDVLFYTTVEYEIEVL